MELRLSGDDRRLVEALDAAADAAVALARDLDETDRDDPDTRPVELVRWLEWVGAPDCRCPSQFKSLGRLHGGPMGNGWVRTGTDPTCRHHGDRDETDQDR